MYQLQPIPETGQAPLLVEDSEVTEAQSSTSSKLVLLPYSKTGEEYSKK